MQAACFPSEAQPIHTSGLPGPQPGLSPLIPVYGVSGSVLDQMKIGSHSSHAARGLWKLKLATTVVLSRFHEQNQSSS